MVFIAAEYGWEFCLHTRSPLIAFNLGITHVTHYCSQCDPLTPRELRWPPYCWAVVKVLTFRWASSETTPTVGGRDDLLHVGRSQGFKIVGLGRICSLPVGVKPSAPYSVFSDSTLALGVMVENNWNTLAWPGEAGNLGSAFGVCWHGSGWSIDVFIGVWWLRSTDCL